MPGDGIIVSSVDAPFGKLFQPDPLFSLSGITDGITVTVFPETTNPETVVSFLEVQFIPETACGFIAPLGFNTGVGPVINNVRSYFTNVSQSQLNNIVSSANMFPGACGSVTVNDLAIRGVVLYADINRIVFFTELDALAVGIGENVFPMETTPAP